MNENLIAFLNQPLLASEYAARQQYGHHEAIARDMNLTDYADYLKARKDSEQEHIEELQALILFLGGIPTTDTGEVNQNDAIEPQLDADEASEVTAISDYQQGIVMAVQDEQEYAAGILRHIQAEESKHLNDIRAQKKQIELYGFANWAANQAG